MDIIWLIVIGTSIWVYCDARNIGIQKPHGKAESGKLQPMGPLGWAFGSLLLWIVFFPLYLIKRPNMKQQFKRVNVPPPPIHQPATNNETAGDFDEQLRRLAQLREEGVISAEDFEQKKNAILKL